MNSDGAAADSAAPEHRPTSKSTGGYYVYVVDLKRSVMQDQKFADKNPHYVGGKPCVYVGMTGLLPEQRFQNHMRRHRASKYVYRYGKRLREDMSEGPISREDAEEREPKLAAELRAKGWAVWQN
jgi:hypothetical protein